MLRRISFGLILVGIAATARAEPPPVPYSQEREEYCQHYKAICEQNATPTCASSESETCLSQAMAKCATDFDACVAEGPEPGPEPISCDALFSKLRYLARKRPAGQFYVLWTTNYLAHGYRWAAWTGLSISRDEGSAEPFAFDLFGRGKRNRNSGEIENVALRIRGDNKIMLSETYGPYEPVCSAANFAVIYSGDSIEAFSFIGPY